MKRTTPGVFSTFASVTLLVLSTASIHAAGTNTWIGNTDANWNTAANWTTSGGSTPPASGDSLVFGAAGSAGTSLNNNISGLTVLNFNINSGASAFTFGGNGFALKGTLTDAASVNETFSSGFTIGSYQSTAIKNTGSGTLALGALSQAVGGTVDFTTTGPITTTTANDATGIIGGWATTGNSVSSATTGDWVCTNGSGNIVAYTGYTIGTAIAGLPTTANFKNTANATCTASTTINSLVEAADITLSAGVTLTLNSGGMILWGPSKWLKNAATAAGGSEYIVSGLASGELYIHAVNAGATDFRIWPIIKDGVVPTALIKDGAGYVGFQNNNTYSGGTFVNSGTVSLYVNTTGTGASVTSGPLGTGLVTLNGGTVQLNAKTLGNNLFSSAGTASIIDNSGNNGTLNGNLTGSGTVTIQNSSGNNLSTFINGDWSGFTGTLNYYTQNRIVNIFTPAGSLFDLSKVTMNVTNTPNQASSSFRSGTGQIVKFGSLAGPSGYMDNAGTFEIGYLNTSTTFSGAIRNNGSAGSVTKVGTGALTLSGGSTYTGLTVVQNGALVAGANAPASANGPFGNSAADVALGDTTTISSNYSPSLLIGGAFTVGRGVTVGATADPTTGIYSIGGNGANNATFSGAITLNQNLVVTQATGGLLTISGSINGSGNLTKVGAGTVTLSGANGYTGSTIVNSGALLIANSSQPSGIVTVADGAVAGVTATMDTTYWSPSSLTVGSATGGTLQFDVFGTSAPLIAPSSLTLNGTTSIKINSAPLVSGVSYPLLSGYTSGTLVLASQPGGVAGYLQNVSGTIYYTVTNVASTYWTASVNTTWDTTTANWTNAFGGNKFAAGAPLIFDDSANGVGSLLVNITPAAVAPSSMSFTNTTKSYTVGGLGIIGSASLTKAGNNVLTLTGTNSFSGPITLVGGTLEIGAAGQLGGGNYSAAIQDDTTLKFNSTAAQTLSGSISGNGALIKASTGALTLSTANSYAGGTVVSNGILVITDSSALGTGSATLAGGTLLSSGTVNLANNIVAQDGTTSVIDVTGGGNLTLNSSLSGGGTITRGSSATLSLFFGGDNSGFTGTYQDQNSANSITRWNSPNSGSASARWIFNQAQIASRTTLNFGAGTIQFGSISGTGFISQNFAGQEANMEVGALGLNDTFAGSIQNGAGTISLTKVGAGTLTLSGVNTYSGPTTVSQGALIVSTASTGNSAYTVADSATLGVSVVGGGSLNVSSLTFGNSGNNYLGLSSTVNPAINNAGSLTLNGTVTVNVQQSVLLAGQYPLITSASIDGTGDFVVGTLPGGVVANIETNGTTIVLNVTTGSSPFIWTGLNNANWDLVTANNWSSNGVALVYTNAQAVRFDDTSSQTNVSLATNVAPASVLVTNSLRTYTFVSTSNAITGSASLTKTGNGTLIIANTNTFTGGTIINNGNLQLGDGAANNGVLSGAINDNAKLVFANPFDQTFSGIISGTGSVVAKGAGILTLGVTNGYSGGTIVSSRVLLPNGATNSFGSGTLTLSNATLIVKPGGGNSYASANSDYIGNNVLVPAGTTSVIDDSQTAFGNLWVGSDIAQWTGSGTVKFQNNSGVQTPALLWIGNPLQNFTGTITLGSTNSAYQVLSIFGQDGGGAFTSVSTFEAAGTAWNMGDGGYSLVQCAGNCSMVRLGSLASGNASTVVRGSAAQPVTYEVGALNTSSTFAGSLIDWPNGPAVSLTKVGTGTLTLSGANAYTGDTTVSGGTLEWTQPLIGTNSTVSIASGAKLKLSFGGNNQVGALVLNGVAQPAGTYNAANTPAYFLGTGSLVIPGAGPTGPGTITNSISGNTLTLNWPAGEGWRLESQTNSLSVGLGTNWGTVSGAADGSYSITIDRTKPTVFYRLVYP